MRNIILIAPPAAGKGTLANILSKEYNIPHISTGDLLRKRSNVDDELGIDLLVLLKTGELVDDKIVLDLLKERLMQPDCKNGYVLDGYPRNINQAVELNNILGELNISIDHVIYLDVDKETSLRRITGRMSCSNCGAIYNKYDSSKLPKLDGICDECSSKLDIRIDDNKESFEQRYETFEKYTLPVVNFYQNTGKLIVIDGTIASSVIAEKVIDMLKGDL